MEHKIIETNSERFETDVFESKKPSVVYFYSEESRQCKIFAPVYKAMAKKIGDNINFIMVSTQKDKKLAKKYDVQISPTLLFIKNGKEVCSRLYGYIRTSDFKIAIRKITKDICKKKARDKVHVDVLIIGGGPAGLSSAIYTSRARLFTIVLDEGFAGGQVAKTYQVANYPGTNGVVIGADLMENMKKQAVDFGTQIEEFQEILDINLEGKEKYVKTEDADFYAKSVIIATGVEPRPLPVEEENKFRGKGLHYCASCDAALYQDAEVIVVGGGNSATEEAVFITRFAKHVTIVHQFDHFQASKGEQEEVFKNKQIDIIWENRIKKINGQEFVESVTIENLKTGEEREIKANGIFVYIGALPNTNLFKNKINLSEQGYIISNNNLQTNIIGVYCAGDVREKNVRQIATAVGDGVEASIMVEKYISGK